jgi:hypothetical protein
MIKQLFAALNAAHTEALLVAMPEAKVMDVTTSLTRRWGADRETIINRQMQKFGTGMLSARQLAAAREGANQAVVEICYAPPLGAAINAKFEAQKIQHEDTELYLFIGQHLSPEQAISMEENERRLGLALRSGGYALWDYNFETGEPTTRLK